MCTVTRHCTLGKYTAATSAMATKVFLSTPFFPPQWQRDCTHRDYTEEEQALRAHLEVTRLAIYQGLPLLKESNLLQGQQQPAVSICCRLPLQDGREKCQPIVGQGLGQLPALPGFQN